MSNIICCKSSVSSETTKMDIRLLLVLAASALCAVSLQVKRRFYFYYEHKTRDEARSFCREKHTDLATLSSMEDVDTVRSMADLGQMFHLDLNINRAWIGLYDDVESWRWSLSDPSFYGDPGEAGFRHWSSSDRIDSRKLCVTLNYWGDWNVVSCTSRLKSCCCNVTGPNVTFVLITDDMTWTEAQSYCREHHTDLASVRNMAENEEIKDMIPFLNEVWIGLYRESWKWFDGSDSTFRDWNLGFSEPNNLYSKESCVAADFGNSGKWEDWPCSYKRAFICHTAGITKQVFRLSVQKMSPSPDLRDPAVMEDVFEQLQQKLKDEGLNENIELSWRKQPDGNIFQKVEMKKETKEEEEEEEEEGMSCALTLF